MVGEVHQPQKGNNNGNVSAGLPRNQRRMVKKRTPIPALRYLCRESRSVGEKHYRKSAFCWYWYPMKHTGQPCDFIWVNFDIDTVQIHVRGLRDPSGGDPRHPDYNLIQWLLVECYIDDWYDCRHDLSGFGALKSADFMVSGDYDLDMLGTSIACPDEAKEWGCDPIIVRVIKETGGTSDYDKSKALLDREKTRDYCCSCGRVHMNPKAPYKPGN